MQRQAVGAGMAVTGMAGISMAESRADGCDEKKDGNGQGSPP